MDLIHLLEAVGSHDLEAVRIPAKCLSGGVTRVWLGTNFYVFFSSSLLNVEGVKHTGAGFPPGITSEEK